MKANLLDQLKNEKTGKIKLNIYIIKNMWIHTFLCLLLFKIYIETFSMSIILENKIQITKLEQQLTEKQSIINEKSEVSSINYFVYFCESLKY